MTDAFNVNKEVDLFKELNNTTNRPGAISALHEEYCSLTRSAQASTMSELILAGGNTGKPWSLVPNGDGYYVGLKPPEKDIFISLKCDK